MAIFTLIVGIILGLSSGASYLQCRKLQEEISAISDFFLEDDTVIAYNWCWVSLLSTPPTFYRKLFKTC